MSFLPVFGVVLLVQYFALLEYFLDFLDFALWGKVIVTPVCILSHSLTVSLAASYSSLLYIITDRSSEGGNAIASVRPSARPSVRPFVSSCDTLRQYVCRVIFSQCNFRHQ